MSSSPTATAELRRGGLTRPKLRAAWRQALARWAGRRQRPPPTETPPGARASLSLFWRTFFLLSVLLLGSLVAWLQIFRSLESTPHAVQSAQQLASLVNLSRASLRYSDALARLALLKTLAEEEGLDISPRQDSDRYQLLPGSDRDGDVVHALQQRLGPGTVVARSVNGQPGLWVGFAIEGDAYWLRADDARLQPSRKATWLVWLLAAGVLSLLGAAWIAHILNRPLGQLALAATRLREGRHDPRLLDEQAPTTEIRELNIGFNRMAAQLSKLEQDRALMLAGISHDLRTPLARLRLDTEISVQDAQARAHMAADIDQLDAIIDKFLDYARPQSVQLQRVDLDATLARAVFAFEADAQMRVQQAVPGGLAVLADPVELLRVLSNLLENARRYGRSPDGLTRVDLHAQASKAWVLLTVADHGPGVPPEQLRQLTRPFFRADPSRQGPPSSGLGLAIVEASVLRMGGGFSLGPAESGGLCAQIRLRRA